MKSEDLPIFFTVIPEVKFDTITLAAAVQKLRAAWQQQAPGRRIPQILLVNIPSETTVTAEFSAISVHDCLRYLALGSGSRLRLRDDTVTFYRPDSYGDEAVWLVPVSPKGEAFLGLTHRTTTEELRARLSNVGIRFADASAPLTWHAPSRHIAIMVPETEIQKLYGILALIDEGYEIRKGAK